MVEAGQRYKLRGSSFTMTIWSVEGDFYCSSWNMDSFFSQYNVDDARYWIKNGTWVLIDD